jgi:hypothetical protein
MEKLNKLVIRRMIMMNKNKKFLTQSMLVYIIANCLSKTSFRIKLIAYIVLIIFCVINLSRSVREKSSKVEMFAIASLIIFLLYSLGGVVAKEYGYQYIYIYNSSISWIVRIIFALVMVISFGFYGYSYVDVESRGIWVKYVKIISIFCLIILCAIGVLYIFFP